MQESNYPKYLNRISSYIQKFDNAFRIINLISSFLTFFVIFFLSLSLAVVLHCPNIFVSFLFFSFDLQCLSFCLFPFLLILNVSMFLFLSLYVDLRYLNLFVSFHFFLMYNVSTYLIFTLSFDLQCLNYFVSLLFF